MLSTDTYVKIRINRSSKLYCHLHKLTNTILVKLCKWVILKYLRFIICIKELTSVIS